MLPATQCPAHDRDDALRPQSHPAPWRSTWWVQVAPGTLTKIQMPSAAQSFLGKRWHLSVLWEADQAQAGVELRRCLPSAPCGHPPTGLPALAGKELTSRLLSVNVELLIPTAKPVCRSRAATGVGRAGAEGAPVGASAGARTPGPRTFHGDSEGTVPASPGPCPPSSFRSRLSFPEATRAVPPTPAGESKLS